MIYAKSLDARDGQGALELLEGLHFLLGLLGFALFAVEAGETKMGLGGEGAVLFGSEETSPGFF